MSSYVIDSKHLTSLAVSTAELFNHGDFHKYPFRHFGLYLDVEPKSIDQVEDIMNRIFDKLGVLNCLSFKLQYGENENYFNQDVERILDKTTGYVSLNKKRLYANLKSLSYQIEYPRVEAITDEYENEYKFLKLLIENLAYDLAGSVTSEELPIYNPEVKKPKIVETVQDVQVTENRQMLIDMFKNMGISPN